MTQDKTREMAQYVAEWTYRQLIARKIEPMRAQQIAVSAGNRYAHSLELSLEETIEDHLTRADVGPGSDL